MNDDRLMAALRASRPALDADPERQRALHARLTEAARPTDDTPPLVALLLAPLSVALLFVMLLLDPAPAPDAATMPSPFDDPEWTIPVTSAEILPWMVPKERPPLKGGQVVRIQQWEDIGM